MNDYPKRQSRVVKAVTLGVPIVNENFVHDSIEKGKMASTEKYEFPPLETLPHTTTEDDITVEDVIDDLEVAEESPEPKRKKRKSASQTPLRLIEQDDELEEPIVAPPKTKTFKKVEKPVPNRQGPIIINNPVDCVFEFGN